MPLGMFFFNDTATTEIYTLSLHDALPILPTHGHHRKGWTAAVTTSCITRSIRGARSGPRIDRKSTRLNSSHLVISYAVFCLKKTIKVKEMHRLMMIWSNNGKRPRASVSTP